ncbi:MFS transporter [Schlegelella sp. S2-27]|uniref:MFS transporter n=2 Tax=Caldimonas mangrovi TaxID=2944811 RepID=A0ABT0YN62_9BURK|nr:MFS transporter [Caldimonas mangrovi]
MSSRSVRTVLPLALVTCTSMLAMDLFLPALPALQRGLDITVAQGQWAVALFLAGLAGSQLLWGEALDRFGPRKCVGAGIVVLVVSSIACALAGDLTELLAMRLLQGVAAGASTVVAPSVIRATLPDADAMKGIASIAMIEAVVPAAAPVAGAAMLLVADWRATFWVVGGLALVALPFVLRVTPQQLPGLEPATRTGYRALLRDGRYRRIAASHALCFGALITFVASGPQMLANALGLGPSAFAAAQVVGVTTFIVVASQAGRIGKRIGAPGAVTLGARLHLLLCSGFLLLVQLGLVGFATLLVFWSLFCGVLAVRGPAAFSEALAVPPAQMGRASALLVLALLAAGAAGTQIAAPFLDRVGLPAVIAVMTVMTGLSLLSVTPYPATGLANPPAMES